MWVTIGGTGERTGERARELIRELGRDFIMYINSPYPHLDRNLVFNSTE